MTLIAAVAVKPDTVLVLDGLPYFVDPDPEVDEYQEMVTHHLRAWSNDGG